MNEALTEARNNVVAARRAVDEVVQARYGRLGGLVSEWLAQRQAQLQGELRAFVSEKCAELEAEFGNELAASAAALLETRLALKRVSNEEAGDVDPATLPEGTVMIEVWTRNGRVAARTGLRARTEIVTEATDHSRVSPNKRAEVGQTVLRQLCDDGTPAGDYDASASTHDTRYLPEWAVRELELPISAEGLAVTVKVRREFFPA